MFTKVLIANRGEIACRIIRTLDRLGIASVAVYSDADADALHVRLATEAVRIGPPPAAQSYLQADRILQVARETGAQAIHPGYGFLSENADFADACADAGITFIGPTATNMRDFGLKHTARDLANASGVPTAPGTTLLTSVDEAHAAAARIGYPIMVKSTAGGGGIGMQMAPDARSLTDIFTGVQRLAEGNFKTGGVFLEKFISAGRHVEVQIFGDGHGTIAVLGERDCSAQRRNQKVLEETPAPGLPDSVRDALHAAARRLGEIGNYQSAGTCEFLYDATTHDFYFLEVNTRLQVEHCVTEAVSGIDLVEWMIRLAAGETLPLADHVHRPTGHAIEARIYAEDPSKNFQPSSGLLTEATFPPEVRIDGWVERGTEITPFYDPMLAKIIAHAPSRAEAIDKLLAALQATRVGGIETNLNYVAAILQSPEFRNGCITTSSLAIFSFQPRSAEVLAPGTHTTIQDYPGRVGYWEVGVPPSGPMDHLAFRLANRLVGNSASAAALECTVTGPTLRFHHAVTACVTGANLRPTLDGQTVPLWKAFPIAAGSTLALSAVEGPGCRAYLAIAGGFDCPDYLGSKATFTLGKFGGHGGRTLRSGDVLQLAAPAAKPPDCPPAITPPTYSSHSEIGVLYGPHGAPDFFTDDDITTFFSSDWEVHYNSSRTGIRLVGPKPHWARTDGGEAGLHPSNIHDNAYAIGAIDFTGDMPVILAVDGPSLGGFVCPAVIVQAEIWKIGQLTPGDTIRFVRWTADQAADAEAKQDAEIDGQAPGSHPPSSTVDSPVLHFLPPQNDHPQVTYRQAGDKSLLVEYGPLALDLNLRFCAHALMDWLRQHPLPGIHDLTPGIRSLQIHYDSRILPRQELLEALLTAEHALPPLDDIEVPSRIVRLPLSWDDPATRLAIEKYTQSVRKDAPWCPDNIEFIRRINGLDSIEQVRDTVFSASYLVLGLGDVYLGAPVATPIDPRHRLVTTKYNPARTWTPENAVGIGGAYLCIYGMEGPGGYQFVGRTIQMWNRWRSTPDFPQPWLLRHFDQIQFYPVSADELTHLREDFPRGNLQLDVRETTFRLGDYRKFLASIATESAAFKSRQQAAFESERERWRLAGITEIAESEAPAPEPAPDGDIPPGAQSIPANLTANVWKITVAPGDTVTAGDTLIILEAMKMEIAVCAPTDGTIHALRCAEGQMVTPGQPLAIITPS